MTVMQKIAQRNLLTVLTISTILRKFCIVAYSFSVYLIFTVRIANRALSLS